MTRPVPNSWSWANEMLLYSEFLLPQGGRYYELTTTAITYVHSFPFVPIFVYIKDIFFRRNQDRTDLTRTNLTHIYSNVFRHRQFTAQKAHCSYYTMKYQIRGHSYPISNYASSCHHFKVVSSCMISYLDKNELSSRSRQPLHRLTSIFIYPAMIYGYTHPLFETVLTEVP
jgi:hypothetical protein